MMIYGLSTCSLCQRARKDIEAAGKTVEFRDVRADPLTEAEIEMLISEFGDTLVDRTTNDFRGLNAWLKNSNVEDQIAARPKVMARPIIHDGDTYHLGWDDAVRGALLDE